MTKIEITKQIVARGSYGIAPINPVNGTPKRGTEHVINVWHVTVDGRNVGTFASRAQARDAAVDYR